MEPVNVTVQGHRDFADVIKLRILRWEDYPGLFGWIQHNYRVLRRGGAGRRARGREDALEGAEVRQRDWKMLRCRL